MGHIKKSLDDEIRDAFLEKHVKAIAMRAEKRLARQRLALRVFSVCAAAASLVLFFSVWSDARYLKKSAAGIISSLEPEIYRGGDQMDSLLSTAAVGLRGGDFHIAEKAIHEARALIGNEGIGNPDSEPFSGKGFFPGAGSGVSESSAQDDSGCMATDTSLCRVPDVSAGHMDEEKEYLMEVRARQIEDLDWYQAQLYMSQKKIFRAVRRLRHIANGNSKYAGDARRILEQLVF